MHDRDNDRESNVSSTMNDSCEGTSSSAEITSNISERSESLRDIDVLFSRKQSRGAWRTPRTPDVLGELQDSRFMLPLLFPSDPKLLSGVSLFKKRITKRGASHQNSIATLGEQEHDHSRAASRASSIDRNSISWTSRSRQLRAIGIETLEWVDNVRGQGRWAAVTNIRSSAVDDGENSDREAQETPLLKLFEAQARSIYI